MTSDAALPAGAPELHSALLGLLRLPINDMVATCARAVEDHAVQNDVLGRGELTRFHARSKPTIELRAYLSRLVTYAPFTSDVLILAMQYLHRLTSQARSHSDLNIVRSPPTSATFHSMKAPGVSVRSRRPVLNSYTVHRLMLAALVVAAKFLSDSYIPHVRACRVGGIGPAELGALEVEVLLQLGFELLWPTDALESLAAELLRGEFAPPGQWTDRYHRADETTPLSSDASTDSSAVSTPESEVSSSMSSGGGPPTPESPARPVQSTCVTPKLDQQLACVFQT